MIRCCARLASSGLSCAAGLGYVFDEAHEKSARLSIVKYDEVTSPPFHDMQGHFSPGDTGIRACTYPNGKLGNGMRVSHHHRFFAACVLCQPYGCPNAMQQRLPTSHVRVRVVCCALVLHVVLQC